MSDFCRWTIVVCSVTFLGADWPQFLGPRRDGNSMETGLATSWPKKGPPVLWEREVGDGYSSPVIAGERLLLFHAVGGMDVLECMNAATGKTLWKVEYRSGYVDDYGKGDGPRTTPLIAEGRAYTLGALGQLYGRELATGKELWRRDLMEDYKASKGFFGMGPGLLLEGDALLVNVGARGAGIVAFDKLTGKELWKATDHEASYASPVAATIDGVRHAIFLTREGLVSLNPTNGDLRFAKPWRARIQASVNAATPIVAGDLAFVSSSYGTGALTVRVKKNSFEEVWKNDATLSCHYNTPVLHEGYLYGIDGRQESRDARLVCVELKTGKTHWARDRFGCASIIVADGQLLLLDENGDLIVAEANPEAYREKARASVLTGPVRGELALSGGRLFARDGKKLVCWNVAK